MSFLAAIRAGVGGGSANSHPLPLGQIVAHFGTGLFKYPSMGQKATRGTLCISTWSFGGRRQYLLAPLLGDAIILAARTMVHWDTRFLRAAR